MAPARKSPQEPLGRRGLSPSESSCPRAGWREVVQVASAVFRVFRRDSPWFLQQPFVRRAGGLGRSGSSDRVPCRDLGEVDSESVVARQFSDGLAWSRQASD